MRELGNLYELANAVCAFPAFVLEQNNRIVFANTRGITLLADTAATGQSGMPLPTPEWIYSLQAGHALHIEQSAYLPVFMTESSSFNRLTRLLVLSPLSSACHAQMATGLFRHILNNLPQYIFWKNHHSQFMGCNNNFAQLVGLTRANDIVGKSDFDLPWSFEQSQRYRDDDYQVMLDGCAKLYYEETQRDHLGNQRTVLVSKIPLFDDQKTNQVTGLAGIYQDITEVKQLEMALLNSTLHAEAANQAKSEFIANISHDIRTPITGMLGLAQYLKDSAKSSQIHTTADLLINSTEELLSLLNEVIDIIDLDPSKPNQLLEVFNPRSVIKHNFTLLAPAARHKNLNFYFDVTPAVPLSLFGHRLYFDRILLNLLSNAVKFTAGGEVRLELDATPLNANRIELILRVIDTGMGIPRAHLNDIFERYARLASSSYQIFKGSGLGLHVVKQYVKAMGGVIHVDSQLGSGSCFRLRIPIELSAHAEGNLRKQCVYILEGNAIAEFMTQQLLQQLGCQPICIRSVEDFPNKLTVINSVILITLKSSLLEPKLIRHLTQRRHGYQLVGITDYPLSQQEQLGYQQIGFEAFIAKPLDLGSLKNLLSRQSLDINL